MYRVLNREGSELCCCYVATEIESSKWKSFRQRLNKTEEAAKKIGTGAVDVLSNISGEIKEGINGK